MPRIKVCQTCHADPCECPSGWDMFLVTGSLMAGSMAGLIIASAIYGREDFTKVGIGAYVGGFIGTLLGLWLLSQYGSKKD